jgi:hypothetical protein
MALPSMETMPEEISDLCRRLPGKTQTRHLSQENFRTVSLQTNIQIQNILNTKQQY